MGRGRAYVGSSGFAYPDWAPRFYPAGTPRDTLLQAYADRLSALELNNTFYHQPSARAIARWLAATPADFRFVVKAQRGASMRAFGAAARETMAWLTVPYRLFGERLGAVLYRVPENVRRDDARLAALLEAWPAELPLVTEFQHDSWHADEVHQLLQAHATTLCATDLDDADPPDLRLTGRSIYLRLRRRAYTDADLAGWADRLTAFLDSGSDCYVFFRHDANGESALRAVMLRQMLG
jgi:uncharacterized protein YecE (DUF72 family)